MNANNLDRKIDELTAGMNAAIRKGDYVEAANVTEQLDDVKLKTALRKQGHTVGFLKALVVPDKSPDAVESQSVVWLTIRDEADVIVTVSGKVIKNRYGEITPTSAPTIKWARPKLESPVIRGVTLAEQALEKLSGDLSQDNVAAAKAILKKIIG